MAPLRNSPEKAIRGGKITRPCSKNFFIAKNKPFAGLDFKKEKQIIKKGYWLVGIDEAGRGPLAGPVVAAAVLFKNTKINPALLEKVRDSKELSEKKREEIFKILTREPDFFWGLGRVGPKTIDRINILEATRLAMKRAVNNLLKNNSCQIEKSDIFLLIDGRIKLGLGIKEGALVAADKKIFSCAAASIIAKVSRDRALRRYHRFFPVYGFKRHKGYGTKFHLRALKKYQPCRIHRFSFKPVSARPPFLDASDRDKAG